MSADVTGLRSGDQAGPMGLQHYTGVDGGGVTGGPPRGCQSIRSASKVFSGKVSVETTHLHLLNIQQREVLWNLGGPFAICHSLFISRTHIVLEITFIFKKKAIYFLIFHFY